MPIAILKKVLVYSLMLSHTVPCSFRAKPGGVQPAGSDSQKTGAAPEPEDLIAPGTPIQFDIMLPASEFQDQNRAGGRWARQEVYVIMHVYPDARCKRACGTANLPQTLAWLFLLYHFQEAEFPIMTNCFLVLLMHVLESLQADKSVWRNRWVYSRGRR